MEEVIIPIAEETKEITGCNYLINNDKITFVIPRVYHIARVGHLSARNNTIILASAYHGIENADGMYIHHTGEAISPSSFSRVEGINVGWKFYHRYCEIDDGAYFAEMHKEFCNDIKTEAKGYRNQFLKHKRTHN